MTAQHPAAPETETDANGLRELLRLATPAPWSVAGVDGQGFAVHRGEHETVALYCDRDNARLIAAAVNALPALLAALDAARERVRVVEGERDAAQLALGEQADVEREAFGRGVAWAMASDDTPAALARTEAERDEWERLHGQQMMARDSWIKTARDMQARAESAEAARLPRCEQDHGAEGNPARVYGHHGSPRTCIRLKATDEWVYDPAWEDAR